MLADIDGERAAQEAQRIVSEHGLAIGTTCDVADEAQVAAMIDLAIARYGRLDMAFNNAGIQVPPSDAADEPLENFERVTGVNQRGVWACMKHELRVMRAQGSGAIVNCSSLGGLVGLPQRAAYHGTKHAVIGMTRNSAFMYATSGLRFNVVAPGGVATGIQIPKDASQFGGARLATVQANMPGVASAAHLASSICFLASDDGVNVNGAVLPSDGGWSAV